MVDGASPAKINHSANAERSSTEGSNMGILATKQNWRNNL